MNQRASILFSLGCWIFGLLFTPDAGSAGVLTAIDERWDARAHGELDGRASPGPIEAAIAECDSALTDMPERIDVRWRLLRALHFSGDYVSRGEMDKRQIFERAVYVGDEGIEQIERLLGLREPLHEKDAESIRERVERTRLSSADVGRLYFWSAINLGAWSQHVGTLEVVRKGVADRVRGYTHVAIALDPEYEEGGALRLLARIHAVVPRLPLFSPWVDPEKSIAMAARAYELAPANPGNQLLYALTLEEFAPERRAEAVRLFEEVAELTPRPAMRIEDLVMRKQAAAAIAAMPAPPPQ